jgi:hypothetical protein
MRTRLRTVRSDESVHSVETAVWDPLEGEGGEESQAPRRFRIMKRNSGLEALESKRSV